MKGTFRAALSAATVIVAGLFSTHAIGTTLRIGAVATVVQLYHDYAWEAVIDDPPGAASELFAQPAAVLSRYIDRHMVDLIIRDRLCERRTRDICRLDYAPIWDSQDPHATHMTIKATRDPSIVAVDFAYAGNGTHMHITYVLVQTQGVWRIADIQGSSASLRKVLEANLRS